jgi:hypothetical protein
MYIVYPVLVGFCLLTKKWRSQIPQPKQQGVEMLQFYDVRRSFIPYLVHKVFVRKK